MSEFLFGWPRINLSKVPSTMPLMSDLAHLGARHGTVVTADFQSAGTGRDGRQWVAPAGSSLLMSVLIRTARSVSDIPILSLLMASAVADTVEAFGVGDVSIKWPNDVLVRGHKISGILLRSRPELTGSAINVVVGIGLNLTAEASRGHPNATNLADEGGESVTRGDVQTALLAGIEGLTKLFEADCLREAIASLSARLAFRGELVELNSGQSTIQGVLSGLRDDGALIVELDGGQRTAILSGELQRGPRRVEPVN